MLLCILLCIGLGACASSKDNESEHAADVVVGQDSIPAAPAPMAPGSARVSAEVLDVEEAGDALHCRIRIRRVDAYGAAAPPLPEGAEIIVQLRKSLLAGDRAAPAAGDTLALTLLHQKAPALPGKKAAPAWRVSALP